MKFTLLLTIGALFTAAAASAPNTSNTDIKINSAPRPAISKSRVTSTLGTRAPLESIVADHAALQYRSNAILDASSDAVKARSAMSAMSRKARTHRRASSASSKAKQRSTKLSSQSQSHSTDDNNEMRTRRSGMAKARRQRTRATQQQRRTSKFLPSRK